nr:cyclic nucleotide-gated ion channel 1 [Quercus suber]
MACWHKACEIHGDGVEISFNCDHSFRKLSFLDDFCPIDDTPNPSSFDFGIFLEARRSRILESTSFLQKVFYCCWWGLRNLSSFGSNLQTSSDIWENIFALGISIFGLLLFLYFMGNLQGSKFRLFWSTLKLLVGLFLDWYEGILVFCHVIAVSLDPLFFYVPVIKEDKRCIELNNVLWTIAIVLRSVTDVVYLVHFVVKSVVKSKIRKERNDESNSKEHSDESRVKGRRYFWPFFMLNILVILPIPQVLMSKILSEMRRAKYTNYVTILNAVILSQYVPRVLQIYLSLKELGKNKIIPIRIRASFNFFLYILAGYVYMQRSASKNVENSENNDKKLDSDDAGFEKSLKELRQLYMQRSASKYVENSENNDKKLDSDDAGFEKLLKELGELYKQRGASKSPENSERVQNFESPETV